MIWVTRYMKLGERESDTAKLAEAALAFREALKSTSPRAGTVRLGQDPVQPRQCAGAPRGTRAGHGKTGSGGRRLS